MRDGHPTTPLLIVSPIFGAWRETMSHSRLVLVPDRETTDPRFPTLEQMRAELRRVVELLRARGDEHIHYLCGKELFDAPDMAAGMMPDQLHPNGEGYVLMGERFAAKAFGPAGLLLPTRLSKMESCAGGPGALPANAKVLHLVRHGRSTANEIEPGPRGN